MSEVKHEDYNLLKAKIIEWENAYYIDDHPLVDDFEYDHALVELEQMEQEHPEWKTPDSPTVRVGGKALTQFEQVQHENELLSLDNSYNAEDLLQFDLRTKGMVSDIDYAVEYKIDGLSVALKYEDGLLVQAATRGDGFIGENVTENIKTIKSIPLKLKDPVSITVRGEVFIPKDKFLQMNLSQREMGLKEFANPRNASAGSLRQLDSKITAKRPLDIYIFDILSEVSNGKSHIENLEWLKSLGFKISKAFYYSDMQKIVDDLEMFTHERQQLSFDIDGLVVKVNQLEHRKMLGVRSKSPKWAISYKFPPEGKETILEDIIVQVGRTGVLTPTAVLKPVFVAGSTISRATLHNQDYIDEKDIRIGDTVVIQKAGDVIPRVVKVVLEKRSGNERKFILPDVCPECNTPTINKVGEVALRCPNELCPAKANRKLIHFVSRDAMNIDGFGESIVIQLMEEGFIENIADIYTLYMKRDEIIKLDRLGEKSIDNLLSAIDDSKKNNLNRLINAFGIPMVGKVAARKLAEAFGSLDALMQSSEEELIAIDEIGVKMANSIVSFFNEDINIPIIKQLMENGVNSIYARPNNQQTVLKDKKIVVTGSLEHFTRDEIKEKILLLGGTPTSSVSSKTDFVIVGANPGSKYDKALSLGVKVITEEEFLEFD